MADSSGFAVEAALDELYAAGPDDFTALRADLAARAKAAGDPAAAERLAGSRKPTTAAWVVNLLALTGPARDRLSELGTRLREAHAAMDGATIRALTAEQRRLVDEFAVAGLRAAGLDRPSAALRDDVTATLSAAVADPDVAARLGRLTKAEQWSGFGEFGFTAAVSTKAAPKKQKTPGARPETGPQTRPAAESEADRRAQQAVRKARAEVAAAERTKADADAALAELQSDLATARMRHQDAQRRLRDAEVAMTAAQDAYDAAKRAAREAADTLRDAKRRLRETGS